MIVFLLTVFRVQMMFAVNIGGPDFHRESEAGDTWIVASAGDTGIVASRMQEHWEGFRVRVIFLGYPCQQIEDTREVVSCVSRQ